MRVDGRRKMEEVRGKKDEVRGKIIINAKKGAFLEKKSYIRNVKLK